jgi:hypothetical protein
MILYTQLKTGEIAKNHLSQSPAAHTDPIALSRNTMNPPMAPNRKWKKNIEIYATVSPLNKKE